MPKFYISDGKERVLIDDKTPEDACVRALLIGKFSTFLVNGYYIVSELGFEPHDNDIIISSDTINTSLEKVLGFDFKKILDFLEGEEKKDKDSN
jgi:hypothetical protein